MFYTVSEVADLTNLSKVSIYNKLKLSEMKNHITKKQGVTYIDDDGLKKIKADLRDGLNSFKQVKSGLNSLNGKCNKTLENTDFKAELTLKTDYINYLKAENERLWNELQGKNNQIEHLSRLVENGQVLLREKPKQDIQLLQEHCIETDEKIMQIKERLAEAKEQTESKKGFFSRIFGN